MIFELFLGKFVSVITCHDVFHITEIIFCRTLVLVEGKLICLEFCKLKTRNFNFFLVKSKDLNVEHSFSILIS